MRGLWDYSLGGPTSVETRDYMAFLMGLATITGLLIGLFRCFDWDYIFQHLLGR